MKRILPLLLIVLLLAGCKPPEDAELRMGTEDGGGTGYGTSVQSVLQLTDFYSVTQHSTRDNNLLMLGTPIYRLGESDTYALADGSQVVLTYDSKGVLSDTLYTEFQTGKNYSLFDKLRLLGVLQGGISNTEGENNGNTPSANEENQGGTQGGQSGAYPIFSTRTYRRAFFEGKLSLYLDRTTVLSTFGSPTSFKGRTYRAESYIIDCYVLEDGSMLLLDYGYDRKSLRCAAIQGADGITSAYLGTWSIQTKPADFVRSRIALNQVTSLKKGATPLTVYETLGEPQWFEGNAASHKDVYVLSDGSLVYLSYDAGHGALRDAYQQTPDGKLLEVGLR